MRRSIDDITTIFDISIFSSVVAIVLILILLIYCFRKNKLIFFSGFWFFVALLPQSGLFPINASIAEHFIYVSSIGYFIILTLILKKISYRKITYALLIILLSTYSFLTFQQNKTWKDPVAFYKRIIHFEPFSSIARSNLGNIYQAKRQYILAEIEYMQAYTINNTSFSILASLASLYSAKGDFETALSFYNKIDQLYPNVQNAETLTGRGLLCLYTGKTDKAIEEFNHALSVNPTLNYIHLNLAAAYYAKEEYDKSKSAFYASLGINISSRIIQDQLLKNEEHKEIFSVNSPPEKIYTDIGMFHAKKGQLAIAKACFEKVISLFPEKPDPYFNLGLLYLQQGSINAAKQQFKTTLKKDSSHKPSKEWLLRLKNK